jgi:hypothetical protein
VIISSIEVFIFGSPFPGKKFEYLFQPIPSRDSALTQPQELFLGMKHGRQGCKTCSEHGVASDRSKAGCHPSILGHQSKQLPIKVGNFFVDFTW